MRLAWTGPARDDLMDCWAHIAVHDLRAADRYLEDLRAAARRLRAQPDLGVRLPGISFEGEFRSVVVRNHRIVYCRDQEAVVVYRVWDCRQDPVRLWESLEESLEE